MDLNFEFNRVNVFDRCHYSSVHVTRTKPLYFKLCAKVGLATMDHLTWKPKVKKNGKTGKRIAKWNADVLAMSFVSGLCFFFSLFFFRFSTDWSGVSSFSVVEFVACLVLLA